MQKVASLLAVSFFAIAFAIAPALAFAQTFSISPNPVVPANLDTVVTLTLTDIDPNIAVLFAPEPSPPENIATWGTQGPDTDTWSTLVSGSEIPLGTYTVVLVDASDDGTCTGATSTLAGCLASPYYISTMGTFSVAAAAPTGGMPALSLSGATTTPAAALVGAAAVAGDVQNNYYLFVALIIGLTVAFQIAWLITQMFRRRTWARAVRGDADARRVVRDNPELF